MASATERQPRQGWRRVGAPRSSLALVMAALTGCYHTSSSVNRVPHDKVKQVERVPNGSQLTLRAVEEEPGALAVVAEEQPMCRDQEEGTRTYSIQTIDIREPDSYPTSYPPMAVQQGVSLLLLPLLPVLIPVALLVPDKRKVSEEPSRERPVPYREWRSEQVSCGQPARVVPDIPFRAVARLNQTECLEWRAVTAADGTPSPLPALERTQASVVQCDRPVATGCVWLEPVGEVVEPPELPRLSEPPVAYRTHGALVRTLTPVEAEALGLAGPPSGKACRTSIGASPATIKDIVAVQACKSTLAPVCRSKLDACLAGPDEFCWSYALRCQPRAPEFTSCMIANLILYEDDATLLGR
jgi:hypothetical protein